jgi:CRP-like cAMP-binding protein
MALMTGGSSRPGHLPGFGSVFTENSGAVRGLRSEAAVVGREQLRLPGDAEPELGPGCTLSFNPGEVIYTEGDRVEHWYEVVRGAVSACKLAADGRRQVTEFYLPGDVFGLDDTGTHSLSAEATGAEVRTVVVRRCRRRLDALVHADAGLARRLHKVALEGLARAHARLFLLGRAAAAERVAAFLFEMEDRLPPQVSRPGMNAIRSFSLPMTRGDIADHLGLTVETVSRIFQKLRRAGALALPDGKRVVILDRRALEEQSRLPVASTADTGPRRHAPIQCALAAA